MSHHRRMVVQTVIGERVGRLDNQVAKVGVVPSARRMWTWCALNRHGRKHLKQHTDQSPIGYSEFPCARVVCSRVYTRRLSESLYRVQLPGVGMSRGEHRKHPIWFDVGDRSVEYLAVVPRSCCSARPREFHDDPNSVG